MVRSADATTYFAMSLISLFVLTVDPSVLSYEDWSLREAIDVRYTTVTDDFDF
ncbi:hypothetical protein NLM31_05310 [Bradyrhizobium sp. CCGUVB4N]|nr:hypothetical protein [Bradyrhizobium sp. CCGUVB4N]MCP3379863.1 hypothetical protein [Bradyrhizobium sp. CCGUVB4N]